MKIRLVKLGQLSGNGASIYSVVYESDKTTLFEKFIKENRNSFKSELNNIILRLKIIGKETGARDHFFKPNQGAPGDGVWALYDKPNCKLRLYCIQYGTTLLVLGGGGYKPKNIRALQEDTKLTKENGIMRNVSRLINIKMSEGDISFSEDHYEFEGNLKLNDQNYE
jgi:putative component of toxin-antitoxin plasmid stabilization module